MSEKNWKKIKDDYEKHEADQEISTGVEEETAQHATEISEEDLETLSRATLEEALLLARTKEKENLDKAVRAIAEVENIRRRADRDVLQARLYGHEKLVQSLLPVLDSLEQALATINQKTHGEIGEGVALTLKLLLSTLEKQGVVQLDPVGSVFNPQEHEAMSTQASEDVAPNMVLIVFQKGYKLNDRVIRAARVIVSKAPA